MNSENEVSGFRRRLADVIGQEEPFAWAKRIGIPSATFDRMWNGGVVPKADTLLRISRSSGVSIDWLLTGEAGMRLEAQPDMAPAGGRVAIDADLYGRVAEAVEAAHKDCGFALSTRQIASLSAEVYQDLVNAGGSRDEMLYGLRVSMERLRRELRDAVKNPGSAASSKDRA